MRIRSQGLQVVGRDYDEHRRRLTHSLAVATEAVESGHVFKDWYIGYFVTYDFELGVTTVTPNVDCNGETPNDSVYIDSEFPPKGSSPDAIGAAALSQHTVELGMRLAAVRQAEV